MQYAWNEWKPTEGRSAKVRLGIRLHQQAISTKSVKSTNDPSGQATWNMSEAQHPCICIPEQTQPKTCQQCVCKQPNKLELTCVELTGCTHLLRLLYHSGWITPFRAAATYWGSRRSRSPGGRMFDQLSLSPKILIMKGHQWHRVQRSL